MADQAAIANTSANPSANPSPGVSFEPTGALQSAVRPGAHWLALVLCVVLCLSIGSIFGSMFRPGAWYAALDKPFFNPPNWLFAPAWTLLYILMGVAVWRIWRLVASVGRTRALRLFAVQLALNAAWTPVFFGAHSLAGGLAVILCMAVAIIVTIRAFHPLDNTAAWLLAPYLVWVAFATTLNVALLVLNSPR